MLLGCKAALALNECGTKLLNFKNSIEFRRWLVRILCSGLQQTAKSLPSTATVAQKGLREEINPDLYSVQAVSCTATGQSVSIQRASCIMYSKWSVCIYTACKLYHIQQLANLYLYSVQAISCTATGQSVSIECASCILSCNWSICIHTACKLYPVKQLVSLYPYSVQVVSCTAIGQPVTIQRASCIL